MYGKGIIKGLAVTGRNLLGTFLRPEKNLVTVQYPEEKVTPKENGRVFPFLVHDGTDKIDGLRCVACLICEKECPPQCIYIVPQRDASGKITKKPQIFDIDVSVCMSCQICVEVCPFDAIKMDQKFEYSTHDRFTGLLLHREELAKSNEYYHKIHPSEATAVDAVLAAKKKPEAKPKPASQAA